MVLTSWKTWASLPNVVMPASSKRCADRDDVCARPRASTAAESSCRGTRTESPGEADIGKIAEEGDDEFAMPQLLLLALATASTTAEAMLAASTEPAAGGAPIRLALLRRRRLLPLLYDVLGGLHRQEDVVFVEARMLARGAQVLLQAQLALALVPSPDGRSLPGRIAALLSVRARCAVHVGGRHRHDAPNDHNRGPVAEQLKFGQEMAAREDIRGGRRITIAVKRPLQSTTTRSSGKATASNYDYTHER